MVEEAQPAPRKPKDRDFVETREGLFFCVAGYLHPPDGYTAYLKYSPAAEGRWHRDGIAYHRELAYYHAHQAVQTLDYLRAHHPLYVHYCPVRDMLFSMVPRARVERYYCPEQRLSQILAGAGDPLEEEAARLAGALREAVAIPPADLGVTGSILLGLHDPSFSDIDVLVYGRANAGVLAAALADVEQLGISPLDAVYLDGWCRRVAEQFGLTYRQARWVVSRQWKFADRRIPRRAVSFHPTRSDSEIQEEYADHRCRDAGMARLRATIADAGDAVFLPAIYAVEGVEILEGPLAQVGEIRANEGLFCRVAAVGQEVEARGKLEEVDGGPSHRLVVGSSRSAGPEYLLPVGL